MGLYKFVQEPLSFKAVAALSNEGHVLKLKSATHVGRCEAGSIPFGVNLATTEDPAVPGTYKDSVPIAVARQGVVDVRFYGKQTIGVGDYLTMSAAVSTGCVHKMGTVVSSLPQLLVARALEAKASTAASAAQKVKAVLIIR